MRAFAFAVRSLIRQPARTALGILGIAAVGALLFDMLLLSRGLVISFSDLLAQTGFDVRVTATEAGPIGGPRLSRASILTGELRSLPEIAEAVAVRLTDAEVVGANSRALPFGLTEIDSEGHRQWTVDAGHDLRPAVAGAHPEILLNRALALALGKRVGDEVMLRTLCRSERTALPAQPFVVSGLVAEFPFDDGGQFGAAVLRSATGVVCATDDADDADFVLVRSREGSGPDAAVRAIKARRPDVQPATNEQIVALMQARGFTYFRQISTVLSTITLFFAFLLITVLMTVSVNQRLGEIAAIRALGFSRGRVASDVLWQSALLVGFGGALALPLGLALSVWLDGILKQMPGIPTALHFFVFEPRALAVHVALLSITSLLAAAYPMWLVATLPIATTLRNEVVS